jgi:hypothetical protein
VYFATTYRASDRLLLGTIIVAALGTQFRGLNSYLGRQRFLTAPAGLPLKTPR